MPVSEPACRQTGKTGIYNYQSVDPRSREDDRKNFLYNKKDEAQTSSFVYFLNFVLI
jgi:hypothetical protein